MTRLTNPHVVHEVVMAMTEAINDIDSVFTSEELIAGIFRFTQFTCASVLQESPDRFALRERMKSRAATLMMALQLSSETPRDVPLTPVGWVDPDKEKKQ